MARILQVNEHAEAVSNTGAVNPFAPGAMVTVWLGSPRERFWGMLLDLTPAGLSLRGIDLNSFEDFVSLMRTGEAATPCEVFFPMHRIERVEVDLRSGSLPSLSERFESSAGQAVSAIFGPHSTARSVLNP